MNYGMDTSFARQPLFPEIPDRDQMEEFPWDRAHLDTVPSRMQPGDIVLPVEVAQFNPALVAAIQKTILQHGGDPSGHIAGGPGGQYNPLTGEQHHLKKFLKSVAKPVVRVAAPIVGFAYGGPVGAAAASAAATKLTGGSTKEALLSAGGSYIGAGGFNSANAAGGTTVGQALSTPSTGFGSGIVNAGKNAASTAIGWLPTGAANAMRLAPTGALTGSLLGSGLGQASDMYSEQKRLQAQYMADMADMQNQLNNMQNQFGNIQAGPVNLPGSVPNFNFLPENQQVSARTVDYGNMTPGPGASGVNYLTRVKDRDTGAYRYQPMQQGGGAFSSNIAAQQRRQGFGGALDYV